MKAPPPSSETSPSAQRMLKAVNLGKSFRGRKVISQVDMFLSPGEVVGLLGPNGAGKTTTFYMFVGLVAPEEGTIWLDGRDITHKPMYIRARSGISYLPQEPSIFRKLTVRDNVLAILETLSLSREGRLERLEKLLSELGVSHLARTPGYALSGGERRRVEVARALAIEPRYILLDEPFAGVDPLAVEDIQAIIRHLKSRGIGILITDHNYWAIENILDKAYIIKGGEILVEGTAEKISKDKNIIKYYLGGNFRF